MNNRFKVIKINKKLHKLINLQRGWKDSKVWASIQVNHCLYRIKQQSQTNPIKEHPIIIRMWETLSQQRKNIPMWLTHPRILVKVGLIIKEIPVLWLKNKE